MKPNKRLLELCILVLLIFVPSVSAYTVTISNYDYLTGTPISSTIEAWKNSQLYASSTGTVSTLNLPSGVYDIYAVKENYKTKTIQENYQVDHDVIATNYQARYNQISVNSISPSSGGSSDNVVISLGHTITAQTNTGPAWKESDNVNVAIKATMNNQTKSVSKSLNVREGDTTSSAISFVPQTDFGVVSGTYSLNVEVEITADAWISVASKTIDFTTTCALTNGGVEICDGLDNDCDGQIDEGFSLICGWTPVNDSLSIPGTASQAFNLLISNPDNNPIDIKWYDNGTQVQNGSASYSFIANLGLIGMHIIKADVNNTATSVNASREWQLNVTQASWVTFWGRVIDSETGLPLADKNLSFYQDTEIESKYNDVEQLQNHTYDVWQNLTPKSIPDAITDAAGYFYLALADGIWNYVIQGSREDEMEADINSSKGAKKRDSELDENTSTTNFNAEGHILYSGKYEKQDDDDTTNGNKYTCGQSVRFMMFGVNNGGTDETITFIVGDHTNKSNPAVVDADLGTSYFELYVGNASNPAESLTVTAGNKSSKVFDWAIPCPANIGKHDVHVLWNGNKWHKIGNFFVINDITDPWINVASTSFQTFTNQSIAVGYAAGDNADPDSMPSLVVQIAAISGLPDTSIIVNIDKDIATDGPDVDGIFDNDVDLSAFGGGWQDINLTYNESGYYTARFTATDLAGNNVSKDVNVSVFITEAEADAIATPYYTTHCMLNVSGELRYDYSTTLAKPAPDVNVNLDMYTPAALGGFDVGHEYNTWVDGLNQTEYDAIKAVESDPTVPEYVKIINATTAADFNTTIRDYMIWLETNGGFTGVNCPGLP